MKKERLIEVLAKLKHFQWFEWSKKQARSKNVSDKITQLWRKNWILYEELPEDVKDQYRVYAKRIVDQLEELTESLAEFEHDQWTDWSKKLAKSEKLPDEMTERWQKYWVPYSKLPEEVKEEDRYWSRQVMAKVAELGGVLE